jgi:hypothetical protein
MSTGTQSQWPLNLPSRASAPVESHGFDHDDMALAVEIQDSMGDSYWRCIELDRHDGTPPMPLTWKTLMCLGGEFIERFGYEEAQRYVTAVLDSRTNADALLPFIALVTNLKARYGPRGHVGLSAVLACELAVTGRDR